MLFILDMYVSNNTPKSLFPRSGKLPINPKPDELFVIPRVLNRLLAVHE